MRVDQMRILQRRGAEARRGQDRVRQPAPMQPNQRWFWGNSSQFMTSSASLRLRASALKSFLAALLAAGCGDGGNSPAVPAYQNPQAPVEMRVDDLLARMTLEEKIEQMHGVASADPNQQNATPDNARLGIPGFHMI